MSKKVKWILITFLIVLGVGFLSFGGYKLYRVMVEDATKRIKKGVKKEIVKSVLDPLSW